MQMLQIINNNFFNINPNGVIHADLAKAIKRTVFLYANICRREKL